MDSSMQRRGEQRKKRQWRVRKKVQGTAERPRFCVFKSNRHLYVQLIDDERQITLVGMGDMKSKEKAKSLGTKVAELAKHKNIDTVVFDRGRYKFHGIVALIAEAAREQGLRF